MNGYMGYELDIKTLPVDGQVTARLTIRHKNAADAAQTCFPLLGPYPTEDSAIRHAVAAARAYIDQTSPGPGLYQSAQETGLDASWRTLGYRRPSPANGWRIMVQLDRELAAQLENEAYRLGGTPNTIVRELLGEHFRTC